MEPRSTTPSPLFHIHYLYILNLPLHPFLFSYSLSFLYFSSLNFFPLSTLFCIAYQISEYNESHLKSLKIKLDIKTLA